MATTERETLLRIRAAIEGVNVKQDLAQTKVLAQELQTLVDDLRARIQVVLDEKETASLQDAAELMGEDLYFGPEAAKRTWEVELTPEQIPPIPFSRAELKRAREMGQMLILRVGTAPDGISLSMKKMNELLEEKFAERDNGEVLFEDEGWKATEEFFNQDTPGLVWALGTKGILFSSTNKNDLQQTQMLVDYVKAVFAGQEMPAEFIEALAEFEREKNSIAVLFEDLDRNWQEAVRRTSGLKLNQLVRRDPSEELHDILNVFENTGERLNEDKCARTARRSSEGSFVDIGIFDRHGADVRSSRGYAHRDIGVSFSRSR